MKNPNGYGSIVKLSGKRRNPFAIRITTGYTLQGKQLYKYIGYYPDRKTAMYYLSIYNTNPYDIDIKNLTLKDIFDRYTASKKGKVGERTLKQNNSKIKHLQPILELKIKDIKLLQLQTLIDKLATAGLATATLKGIKSLLNALFKYALKIEAIEKNYAVFIELPVHKPVIKRAVFTELEIATLWSFMDVYPIIDTLIILIYTGFRINELLNIKKEDVNLVSRIIKGGSKTKAGKDRIVPIHPKILPLIKNRMKNDSNYLITYKDKKYKYGTYRLCFEKTMEELKMKHTIHDTRHTFVTKFRESSKDEASIMAIAGHSNIGMTDKYTHVSVEKMRKELEKIN